VVRKPPKREVFLWKNMKENRHRTERLYSIDGLQPVNHPIMLAEIGCGHPILTLTAAMHGDEDVGVHILDTLRKTVEPENGTLRLIIANPPALFQGVRFLSEDLNRSFAGSSISNSSEARLAPQILEMVKRSDCVVDIHSTSTISEAFAIVGRRNENRLLLAEIAGFKNIVLFEGRSTRAMVDNVVCGIGLELGLHGSKYAYEEGLRAANNILEGLGMSKSSYPKEDIEYFEIFGSFPNISHSVVLRVRNFERVMPGTIIAASVNGQKDIIAEEEFYPVLAGERSYSNLLLKAKKVTRREFLKP